MDGSKKIKNKYLESYLRPWVILATSHYGSYIYFKLMIKPYFHKTSPLHYEVKNSIKNLKI
jgi:hypothetical protein